MKEVSITADRSLQDNYLPSATIEPNTRHLFVDRQHGHVFLFNAYGGIPNSQLVFLPGLQWDKYDLALQYLERSLTSQVKTLTFLTLDGLVDPENVESFIGVLCRLEMPVFGIIHIFNNKRASVLCKVTECFNTKHVHIITFTESLASQLRDECRIQNVTCVPLPPIYSMYLGQNSQSVREFIGAKPRQVIFSVLGELRKGKGVELLMSSFPHLSLEDREQAFFLFGGYVDGNKKREIEKALIDNKCHGYVDLRKATSPLNYPAVLTERELGQYINASDVGFMLYQFDQRGLMSGVLPNFVYARKPIIATSNSLVGGLVKKYDLGMVLNREEPREVANTIAAALRAYQNGYTPTEAYESFRTMSSTDSVVQKFSSILNRSDTALLQPRI